MILRFTAPEGSCMMICRAPLCSRRVNSSHGTGNPQTTQGRTETTSGDSRATQRWLVTVGCSTCWRWCLVGLTEITVLLFLMSECSSFGQRARLLSPVSPHTAGQNATSDSERFFGCLEICCHWTSKHSNWTKSVRTGRRNTTKGMPKKKTCSRVYVPQL
jgi:hypothetical protein